MTLLYNRRWGWIAMSFFLVACSTAPEPLDFGKDICYSCKMTLVDKKFGAELVTKKGKVYKFDDLNCFFRFYHSGHEETDNFAHQLVIDYSHPGKLINGIDAFYLKSSELRTPMASEVAAFESKQNMDSVKRQISGVYLVWGEMTTQFK